MVVNDNAQKTDTQRRPLVFRERARSYRGAGVVIHPGVGMSAIWQRLRQRFGSMHWSAALTFFQECGR